MTIKVICAAAFAISVIAIVKAVKFVAVEALKKAK